MEWLSSKSLQIRNVGEDVEKRELSYNCWWECKLVQPLWRVIKNLKSDLPYDPAIPLLGIYPKKKGETLIQKDTCILVFIAALFTIVKIQKQPECTSVDK